MVNSVHDEELVAKTYQPSFEKSQLERNAEEVQYSALHADTKHPTTYWGNVVNLIVIAIGPALLSLPSTFVNVGYAVGFFGTFFTVIFYMYCMRTIVQTEQILCERLQRPSLSYPDTIREAFRTGPDYAKWFADYSHYIVYGAFLSVWIGGNSVYLLLACNNIRHVYQWYFQTDIAIRHIILYSIPPFIILSWISRIKYLSIFSAIANVIFVLGICVILHDTVHDTVSLTNRQIFGHFASLPLFLGTILFTLNATGIMMALKNDMRNPRRFNSTFGVLTASYVPISVLYAIFGTLCYIKYGDRIDQIVVLNLPPTVLSETIIALFALGIYFLCPISVYVSFEIIWNNNLKNKLQNSRHRVLYEYIVRTCIPLSSITLAYTVPNISLFLSLAGTVSTSLDSIILPALTQILIHHGAAKPIMVFKNIVIIVFALLLIVTGTSNSIRQIIDYYS